MYKEYSEYEKVENTLNELFVYLLAYVNFIIFYCKTNRFNNNISNYET